MGRINFFERMERELDFQHEYEKIDDIVLNEYNYNGDTIHRLIKENFRTWQHRMNYVSIDELRNELGFRYISTRAGKLEPTGKISGINDFLMYCEMICNLIIIIGERGIQDNEEAVKLVVETIKYDLNKINHKIYQNKDGRYIIVQIDTTATAVADIVETSLADELIKYNHYLLKGNLVVKKSILKRIADSLEPKRDELRSVSKTLETDFFYLVNNMNVRHNNCDPLDSKHYVKFFAELPEDKKEEWYDEIYQEGLMAFLTLEQVKRTRKINEFKTAILNQREGQK